MGNVITTECGGHVQVWSSCKSSTDPPEKQLNPQNLRQTSRSAVVDIENHHQIIGLIYDRKSPAKSRRNIAEIGHRNRRLLSLKFQIKNWIIHRNRCVHVEIQRSDNKCLKNYSQKGNRIEVFFEYTKIPFSHFCLSKTYSVVAFCLPNWRWPPSHRRLL